MLSCSVGSKVIVTRRDMRSALEFWEYNNRWRAIGYPILFLAISLSSPASIWPPVYFIVIFVVFLVEVTAPSQVDCRRPSYSDRQRVGYAAFHAFAWTSFAFGVSIL